MIVTLNLYFSFLNILNVMNPRNSEGIFYEDCL